MVGRFAVPAYGIPMHCFAEGVCRAWYLKHTLANKRSEMVWTPANGSVWVTLRADWSAECEWEREAHTNKRVPAADAWKSRAIFPRLPPLPMPPPGIGMLGSSNAVKSFNSSDTKWS